MKSIEVIVIHEIDHLETKRNIKKMMSPTDKARYIIINFILRWNTGLYPQRFANVYIGLLSSAFLW